jgi:WXG100 family type VII secretion target
MAQTAAKFDQTNQDLTSMLNTLMNQLSVLQSAWAGRGAKAFETVRAQYQADLTKINQALAETAEAIKTSGVGYDTTDESTASSMTSAGGGGGYLPLEN